MKKDILSIVLAGLSVLLVSIALLYSAIAFFPGIMEEYYNSVFRASSFETDWLFFAHPFVLAIALKWFWKRYKDAFEGSLIVRALEVAMAYGIVAMVPVLWLTFSAIDISFLMVFTWLIYGTIQAFVAGLIFAKMNP